VASRVILTARRGGWAPRPEPEDDSGPAPERRGSPDSGASSIELVLLAPLVIVCILLIGQFAMWYQARHIAIAAAQYGARYARDTPQGEPWQATAQTQALQYARQLGGTLLQGESAVPITDGSNRGVTVTAGVPRIVPIPGLNLQVKETSEGPIECFRASDNTSNCA
jgi:Flp pilus assembly protein TadG